ncbi:hybrid sensor histidine kinase/response regulator [Pseudoalteromonas ulvae]|nr:PAS domain-containing hybrid sensor histidine kinase/response regulator [Pseudoalteromonas ulvae]
MEQSFTTQFIFSLLDDMCAARNNDEALLSLKINLHALLPCQSMSILALAADQQLNTLISTESAYTQLTWPICELFERAFHEKVVVIDDVTQDLEFMTQPETIRNDWQKVLIFGLHFADHKGIILFHLSPDSTLSLIDRSKLLALEAVFKSLFLQVQQQHALSLLVKERTSALKNSEQRFKTYAELASDWFWEIDDELKYVYLSNSDNEIKYNKYQHFLGKTPVELRSQNESTQLKKWGHFLHILNQREPVIDFEYEVKGAHGQDFWISLSGRAQFDERDQFCGYLGIGKDISYIKHREFEIQAAKEKAEQASAAKSRFLAVMSHEIRTPMNAIIGMLELLEDTGVNEQQLEYLEYIRSSTGLLLTVISDTLDFAKIESGTIELESNVVNLERLINNITKQFETQSVKQGLAFNVSISSSVPTLIMGDAHRLAQVLFNVLGNAFKFTRQGSVSLCVDKVDQDITFTIRDTGIGMNAYTISQLFKPFTQANSSSQRRHEGVGLGLSIAKQLLNLMQGDIQCRSELGQFTEFYFYLPYQAAEQSDSPNKSLAEQKVARLSILVAEDNLANQMVIKALLEKRNHHVTLAENGEVAVILSKAHSYDLVLMDMMMPVMDGLTATKLIRETFTDVQLPIVALTANASLADKQLCLDVGMNDVLTKPVDSRLLAQKVAHYAKAH